MKGNISVSTIFLLSEALPNLVLFHPIRLSGSGTDRYPVIFSTERREKREADLYDEAR